MVGMGHSQGHVDHASSATMPAALHTQAQPERAGGGLARARAAQLGRPGPVQACRWWTRTGQGRPGQADRAPCWPP